MEKRTVDFYRADSQYMNDAIDRIVVEVHTKKKTEGRKTILLTGCGPHTGVTSLSINLAIALSMAGWKTLLIDCDLRKSDKYKRVSRDIPSGLAEYLSKQATKEEVIFHTNHKGLDFIPCGRTVKSAVRLLCSAEMIELMSLAEQEYDYVIIDSPSINIVSDVKILIPSVDGVVLVAAIDTSSKRQVHKAKSELIPYADKYYGIIVNKVDSKEYRKFMKNFDYFEKENMDKNYKKQLKKVRKTKAKEGRTN